MDFETRQTPGEEILYGQIKSIKNSIRLAMHHNFKPEKQSPRRLELHVK